MEIHSRILEFRLEKMLTTEANTLLSVSRLENKTEEERQTGKQIDALCRVETVACLHVSVVRTQANARACVRELVTREAQRSPRTYVRTYVCTYVAAGSVPIMGMQVAKQVPFIHVRRALVAYHLQFPIYHLPSSSAGRVSTSASLSLSLSLSLHLSLFSSVGWKRKREREREKARNEYAALRDNVRLAVLHRMQMVSGLEWLESRPLAASEQVHLEEIDLLLDA